jgi:hypothetical protein
LILSFVPAPEQRLWRTVTRTKVQLTRNRVQLQNRREALLEQAHLKLSSLVADLLGVSARRRLEALADGATDPGALAALADHRLRATPEQLRDALEAGQELSPVYRRLLKMALEVNARLASTNDSRGRALISRAKAAGMVAVWLTRRVRRRPPLSPRISSTRRGRSGRAGVRRPAALRSFALTGAWGGLRCAPRPKGCARGGTCSRTFVRSSSKRCHLSATCPWRRMGARRPDIIAQSGVPHEARGTPRLSGGRHA